MDERNRLCLFIGLVALGGVLVAIASGAGVYYGIIVPRNQTSTGPIINDTCNCQRPPPCKTNLIPFCPVAPAEYCQHPLMVTKTETVKGCPTECPPPPQCKSEYCGMKATKCPPAKPPSGTDGLSGTPLPSSTIPLLDNPVDPELLRSKTVIEWIKMYPVNSYDRLRVVTRLLNLSVEEYIRVYAKRNCADGYAKKIGLCTFCQDRYDYLRCVMSRNVTKNKLGYKTAYRLSPVPNGYWSLQENFAYAAYYETRGYKGFIYDELYDDIRLIAEAFWVVTEEGEECRVCADLDPGAHTKCLVNK